MKCFHPWKPPEALGLQPNLKLPCGRCTGCRLKKSAEWATRCMHEAKSNANNCWVTLTYNDENLRSKYHTGIIHPRTAKPIYGGTLLKRDIQKFFRRLRKHLARETIRRVTHSDTPAVDNPTAARQNIIHTSPSTPTVRYYYCGEYGEKYKRPHYHLCLFGIDFNDKKLVKETDQSHRLYESELLQKLWPHGQHILSELTWETAAYTARYSLAKVNGQLQNQLQENIQQGKKIKLRHYEKIDYDTGEIITLQQEYNDMSRKPGIGFPWLQKWETDVYKHHTSHVRIRGKKTQPPRYYDKIHKRNNPTHYEHIRKERNKATLKNWLQNTTPRLEAEEVITRRKIQTLKHHLETT